MSIIHDIKSKSTQKALDASCAKYHIPACVHPAFPSPNKNIYKVKIGVYTQFFDFANYRIPLSQFLVDVLGHFRIHLSQLSVVGAAKVSYFEILCRVHGFQPSVNCFQMYLFSFIRHFDPTKVLIGERNIVDEEVKILTMTEGRVVSLAPPASDASGGCNDSIDKLFDDGNDAEPEHPTVGDDDVLAETIAQDVSKVAIEKTKRSKRKRKTVGDASVYTFPPKKLREDYHSAASNTSGKSLATIRSLIPEGSSISSEVAEPRDDGLADSVSGLNLRTRPPSMRYVVSSDDSYHSDSRFEVNSFVRSPVADAPVMIVAVTTTVVADVYVVSVSKDRVRSGNLENFGDSTSAGGANANAASSLKLNEPATSLDSFYASQDLDSETLHNIYLYTEFNVGATQKICLGAEVRMRAEHTLEQKDKLEDKCVEQATRLSKKDDEIADLKSLLSLKETEAVEAILVKLTSDMSGFQLSRDELSSKVASLESERDSLADQILTHGLKLVLLKCLQSFEYLPALGETIGCAINKGMQDGLKAGIDHEKAGRDLSVIEAYDPSAKANNVDAMNALRTVDFSLLSVLKSKKDACMADLMDSLRLEGPLAEIPRAKELQPSLD
ncbi:hypothetical protein Tco_0303749 [Tanacetum coccineum]